MVNTTSYINNIHDMYFPVSFWMPRMPCIGTSRIYLYGQIKHESARGLKLGLYLLCDFSEHVQQDNITYAVTLMCQACFACMIYLSGTILDISLQNLSECTVLYQSR